MKTQQEKITGRELADLWGVSPGTVTKWAIRPDDPLPSFWRTPNQRAYYRDAALAWYERQIKAAEERQNGRA